MTDVEGAALDDRHPFVRETHRVGVVVAAHGNDGRDFFELPDEFFAADVARVNNAADAGKQTAA